MSDGYFTDQLVVETGPDATISRKIPCRIEALRRGQSDKGGYGTDAFERRPRFLWRIAERSMIALSRQRAVYFRVAMGRDRKFCPLLRQQQSERCDVMLMPFCQGSDKYIAV